MRWPWHRAPRPSNDLSTQDGRVARDYVRILESLSRIEQKAAQFMTEVAAELAEIKSNQDKTLTALGGIATRMSDQDAKIAALQASAGASLSPEDKAALDGIKDESAALVAATAALLPVTEGSTVAEPTE